MKPHRPEALYAAAVFVAAAVYFASFEPWARPVQLDAATWDYMSVETARGLVPYRDVFLHKTPGAALLGAVAAWFGSAIGVEPVMAAHALFLFLGALAPALLFALCRSGGFSHGASVAAAIAMLAFDEWPIAALEGCRPKVPTVVFGMAAMLAAERGRALSSSLFGGLSVLCWQPGLAFLLAAWATLIRSGERRFSRLVQLGLVSLIPTALLFVWLFANGALTDFFEQSILFNLHYIDDKSRPVAGTIGALIKTLYDWNDVEVALLPAAVVGLWLLRRSTNVDVSTPRPRIPFSLVVSAGIYGAMTFISYQSWPDAILLSPIAGTLLGVGLYTFFAARLSVRGAAVAALLVATLAAVPDDRSKFHPPLDFAGQRQRFRQLAEGLSESDRVVGVSVPEFFLHTGRRNGWKWPYLWFGVDEFAAARQPDGFEGILRDLDENPPAMILVTRLWGGANRERFEEWASARYDLEIVRLYPHVRIPLRVYRQRR